MLNDMVGNNVKVGDTILYSCDNKINLGEVVEIPKSKNPARIRVRCISDHLWCGHNGQHWLQLKNQYSNQGTFCNKILKTASIKWLMEKDYVRS